MLPKNSLLISNGGVYSQQVRCGKSRCRCTRGQPHTAHYFIRRLNGRQIKSYIRKSDVPEAMKLVEEARFLRRWRRSLTKTSEAQLSEARRLLREILERSQPA